METTRTSWDDYFLQIAATVASRATCDRLHVGCVLVRDRTILATGFNGAPRGLAHCDDIGHLMIEGHCVRTVHAELNALAHAAREGTRVAGAVAYVTHEVCRLCFFPLINAGIVRVVFAHASPNHTDPIVRDAAQRLGLPFGAIRT